MTVISEPVADIAGADELDPIAFKTTVIRENATGTGTTTTRLRQFTPVDGVLTTTDLDPGPAQVRIGNCWYDIVIPDSGSPIRLWPLIDAGLPQTVDAADRYVVNAGGVARQKWVTAAEWALIAPGDPDTTYLVKPS